MAAFFASFAAFFSSFFALFKAFFSSFFAIFKAFFSFFAFLKAFFSAFFFFFASRFLALSSFFCRRSSNFLILCGLGCSAFCRLRSFASSFFNWICLFRMLSVSILSLLVLTCRGFLPCNSSGFTRDVKSCSNSEVGGAGGVGSDFFVTTFVAKSTVLTCLSTPCRFFTSIAPLLKITVEAPLRATNKSNLVPLIPIVDVGVIIR